MKKTKLPKEDKCFHCKKPLNVVHYIIIPTYDKYGVPKRLISCPKCFNDIWKKKVLGTKTNE